jgi:GT2 family glycosyltransferase
MISIVIVNYNGCHFLDACLSSLAVQTFQDFEIILVDNGSSDDSVEHVQLRYPSLVLIKNKENRGFAGGVNDGIRVARGDYILTLNNDTIADPEVIEYLMKAMETYKTVGSCAAKMVFPDGRINSAGICISRSGAAWDRGMFEQDAGQFDVPGEVFGPCAGAALYRKKMLNEIGLFDEDFFLFMEDVDLAFRARMAGWKCMYVPSARVIHVHGGTAGYQSITSVYYGNRNLLWYVLKDFPVTTLFLFSPWIIGRNCVIIPYYILNGKGMNIIKAKIDSFFGIWRMLKKRKTNHLDISESELRGWINPWAHFR